MNLWLQIKQNIFKTLIKKSLFSDKNSFNMFDKKNVPSIWMKMVKCKSINGMVFYWGFVENYFTKQMIYRF